MTNNIVKIKWDDTQDKPHTVGLLAQYNGEFYMLVYGVARAKLAYNKGFRGIPGFNPKQVYKSSNGEIFEFFKRRLEDKDTDDPIAELLKPDAFSEVDSFYLADTIPEKFKNQQLAAVRQIYNAQQRIILRRKNKDNNIEY